VPGKLFGKPGLFQELEAVFSQFPQIQLFGLPMLEVEIPAVPAKACGGSHGLETAGAAAGSPIGAFIDEAFDQQHRLTPGLEPVGVKPFEAQSQSVVFGKVAALSLERDLFGQNSRSACRFRLSHKRHMIVTKS
jgi:hypothetical protein